MGQTISEKILSRAMGKPVAAGDIIFPEPDLVTVHDWYVVNFDKALRGVGIDKLYDASKVLVSTDHEPMAVSVLATERQKAVREIVARYGIKQFYDVGRGGHGHVFPMELGIVKPGMFVLAYDTHVTNYGAVGCLGFALVTEISEVLGCGTVWIRVPETIRINLTGRLRPGLTVRDISQKMTADLGADLVDYCVVEYGGPAMKDIDFAGRMTLCNTPLEVGAKSALVEPDEYTAQWLATRATGPFDMVRADPDAKYKAVIDYDLGVVEPQVAAPPRPDNVVGVSSVAGTKIHHAFIGSCANGYLSDLREAAGVLKGKRIHPDVRLIITPATQEVLATATEEGLIRTFVESGAMMTTPGCGPCASGRIGPMAPGEVSINTGTRNDPGRLGTRDGDIYLASPLTVAASAIAGHIADPRELM